MIFFKGSKGFTLIELLIAMAIALVLMTGVYSTYQTQQKAYLIQDQVAAMQQRLRAAMHLLERDIRMAGFDPTQKAGAGILTATAYAPDPNGDGNTSDRVPPVLTFTMDISNNMQGDGDTNDAGESITYTVGDALTTSSENDDLVDDLMKDGQPAVENIEVLDFVFLDSANATTASTGEIRSIEVTLIAKTNDPEEGIWTDRDYTNNKNYFNARNTKILSAPNDNIRRMILTKKIRCRNLGLTGGQ